MKKYSIFLFLFAFFNSILTAQISESDLFIKSLTTGDNNTAYGLFDTLISKKIPPAQFNTIWTSLQSQLGSYKTHGSTRIEESNITYTPFEFEKGTLDLKLVFTAQKKIMGFFFVPAKLVASYKKAEYDNPANYTEKDIIVKTGTYSLPGILTQPVGKANTPIVILLAGSGPTDKDEAIGPNKFLRDIAVGLAANGIASLRYDKRTKVYASELNPDSVTLKEEVIEDANSAISMVNTFANVNSSEIYLLGHSLGGMVAPKIASDNSKVKGIILLAANARPLQDLLLEQTKYIMSLDGLNDNEKSQLDALDKQVKFSKQSSLTSKTTRSELPMNIPAPYWIYLNNYKQVETAGKLKQRIFILQGERDYQVTLDDFNIWKKGMGANKNVTLKSYPKLNHLFIAGENKSEPKDYETPGSVDSKVIQDISEWINKK